MPSEILELESSHWFQRRSNSPGYHVSLGCWFALSFWVLMGVPYWYDWKNKQIFTETKESSALVIREFQNIFIDSVREKCRKDYANEACPPDELYERIKNKRLIALDYVEKMQKAEELEFLDFAVWSVMVFALSLFSLMALSRNVSKPAARGFFLFVIFFSSFSGLPLAIGLPHNNLKFHFTVGMLFTILLPAMDYLHRIPAAPDIHSTQHSIESAKLCHRRWSRILTAALTLLMALLGTISFNIIDYETTIFGEGFIYHPLLGVVLVMVVCTGEFFWGIIRNILAILSEIETSVEKAGSV